MVVVAKEILEMIEAVDPGDSAKLNEIDARVKRYLSNGVWNQTYYEKKLKDGRWFPEPQYTRSRDALKAIRPEGWQFRMVHDFGTTLHPRKTNRNWLVEF
jgi:hypothetical protein